MTHPAGDSPAGDARGWASGEAVPDADVVVDEGVARRLLRRERPDLATLPLAPVASGFDHVTLRLGDDLALRLPRRALGAGMLPGEQRVLPHLADHVGLEVPTPVHLGEPDDAYPYPWAVVRWVPGACLEDAALPATDAAVVADLLGALRAAPPVADPPRNPYRGMPLAGRRGRLHERIGGRGLRRRARDLSVDLDVLAQRFELAVGAPGPDAPTWAHGDLHPRNLVVRPGPGGHPRLAGLLDWSDVTWGDPAVDLVVFWNAFDDPSARADGAASVDADTWERGIGWAIALGVEMLAISDDPTILAIGARCLRNVVAEARLT